MQRTTTTRLPTMASSYPDVLGFISSNTRLTIDCVQTAMSVYPTQVAVGQSFELLILLQNLCDHQISVKAKLQLPRRSPTGERLSLFAARDSLEMPLGAGEVGLLHWPIRPQLPTPVGQQYPLTIRVESTRPRGVKFVRDPNGGRAPASFAMSPHRLQILQHEVHFAANLLPNDASGATLLTHFDILPGQILQPTADASPRYELLWDNRQLPQDQDAYPALEKQIRDVAQAFSRAPLYEALQNETLQRFAEAGLPLLPGEIVAIAKLLTYTMEDGLEIEPGFSLTGSHWFQRLTLFRLNNDLLADMDRLIPLLYTAVIQDAGLLGYSLLAQHLSRKIPAEPIRANRGTRPLQNPLGLPEDQAAHISAISEALQKKRTLDLTGVYWPLALAGALLQAHIRGPQENLWTTLRQVRIAWQTRSAITQLPNAALMTTLMNDALTGAEQTLTRMRSPHQSD